MISKGSDRFFPGSYFPLTKSCRLRIILKDKMIGFQWGYWDHPLPSWFYPKSRTILFPLPFDTYSEGTCTNYDVLDLKLLDDEDLRENVMVNLYDDPAIPRSDKKSISVSVEDKIVRLSGQVRYRQSKVLAYADALQTPGVAEVKNEIEIPF